MPASRTSSVHALRVCRIAALCALTVPAGCGLWSRGGVPEVAGPATHVVLEASLAGAREGVPRSGEPLLLDSVPFTRLRLLMDGEGGLPQLERSTDLVDGHRLLDCPPRRPCRLLRDGVFMTIWGAELTGDRLELVVSRTFNVQGLYVRTRSVTHRITLIRERPGQWRLTSRIPLSG